MTYSPPLANEFRAKLTALLNHYSIDNMVSMPDYILAEYLTNHIEILVRAQEQTSLWRGE